MEVGYIELFGGTGPMIDYIDFYVLSIPFINLSYRFNVLRFLFFSIMFDFQKIHAIPYFCTSAIVCIFSKLNRNEKIKTTVRASLIFATVNSIILFKILG